MRAWHSLLTACACRSPSLQFRLIARARPLLDTPADDFTSDAGTAAHTVGPEDTRRRAQPGYGTGNAKIFLDTLKAEYADTKKAATLTTGTSAAKRKGNSHKYITSGSVTDCSRITANTSSFSTSDGASANSAQNSHTAAANSKEQAIQTFVQGITDSAPDLGKEITQATRLCADVKTKSTETRAGGSANVPKNIQEGPETTTDVTSNSVRRNHGESANKVKLPKAELSTSDKACTGVSASKATTNRRIKEFAVQSVTTFQHYSQHYARTHPPLEEQHEKKNKKSTGDNETGENNPYGHLSGKARKVQDSVGSKAKTSPHFSCKGFNKAERSDDKKRKPENSVSKTSNQKEHKTYEEDRELDCENGIERKVQFTVSDKEHKDNTNVVRSEGCRPKHNQDSIQENGTRIQESTGNKYKKAHKGGKEQYSAGEKRKRAHSSSYKTKQADISATDRKVTQHSISGKVKKTDGISGEKNKTEGVTENKDRIKKLSEGKDDKREYSAQEVKSSATVKQRDTGGTNGCAESKPGGDNNTMSSSRPHVPSRHVSSHSLLSSTVHSSTS